MDLEKKINVLGQLLADIQFEIKQVRKEQTIIKDFLMNPNKLGFEKVWKDHYSK